LENDHFGNGVAQAMRKQRMVKQKSRSGWLAPPPVTALLKNKVFWVSKTWQIRLHIKLQLRQAP
jgi:hypothetical protein